MPLAKKVRVYPEDLKHILSLMMFNDESAMVTQTLRTSSDGRSRKFEIEFENPINLEMYSELPKVTLKRIVYLETVDMPE